MLTTPSVPADVVEMAMRLAKYKHKGQVRRGGECYTKHLRAVANKAQLLYGGNAYSVVGWLHDIVEDTNMTVETLRCLDFPPEIVIAVDLLTRKETKTYVEYIYALAGNTLARRVKMCDIHHNMSDLKHLRPGEARRYGKALDILLSYEEQAKKNSLDT